MIEFKEQAAVAMNVRGQLADPVPNAELVLGALAFADDLGRLLWRMKYGQDVKRHGLERAVLLLSRAVRQSGRFKRDKATWLRRSKRAADPSHDASGVLELFARRAVLEWIADRCAHCGGRGYIGGHAVADTRWFVCTTCNGRGFGEEPIPFFGWIALPHDLCQPCFGMGKIERALQRLPSALCGHCCGSGRQKISDAQRAIALGVPLDQYRRRWALLFDGMMTILDQIDGDTTGTVRRQLRADSLHIAK